MSLNATADGATVSGTPQVRPQVSDATVRKAVVASAVGTAIEWYDYALYGAASGLVISKLFFPTLSPLSGTLATFATFAVGFFARPLGGIIIGHIGDQYGRKPALILTIVLMGFATVAMGLLPTYDQIGETALILLVILRVLQGFGAGAEIAGAFTLVAEYAPPHRRAFFTSIPNVSSVVGVLLGMLAFLALSWLPEEELLGWAWRVPFLMSVLLFFVALYIRNNLDETPEYVAAIEEAEKHNQDSKAPLGKLLRYSPREVLCGFLSGTGHNANSYIVNTFVLSYMVNSLGMPKSQGLIAVSVAACCAIVCGPLFGKLADRIGSAKVFIGGCVFLIFLAYPLFMMLDTKNVVWAAIGISLAYGIGWGCTAGAQGAFLADLFPTQYRFSGIALSREFSGAFIGGPTPFIAASLVALADGKPTLVAAYVMVCCAVSIVAVFAVRKRLVHN